MFDSIDLEKRNIPSAYLCTDLFVPTAKAVAESCGIPSYPFVTIPYGTAFARLSEDEVKELAEVAAPKVMEILLKT